MGEGRDDPMISKIFEKLDYQLHRLELAGLIEIRDGTTTLTEAGKAYGDLVKSQAEKSGAGEV